MQLLYTLKKGGFFLYGRIFRKSKSSFLLTNKCGDQKCLFFLGIKEIPFLNKKYKLIFNVGKIKKILANTQNIIVLQKKNFMAIYKELLFLSKL